MDIFVIFDYRGNIVGYTEDSSSADDYCMELDKEVDLPSLGHYYERVKPIKEK